MKRSFFLISAFLMLIFSACEKNIIEDDSRTLVCKLDKIVANQDSTFLTYDQTNKLIRIDYDSTRSENFETYNMTPSQINYYAEYPTFSGLVTTSIDFSLDAMQRISFVQGKDGNKYTFTYDSNGYLTQIFVDVFAIDDFILNYHWTDGNLVEIIKTDMHDEVLAQTNITYNGDKSLFNLVGSTISFMDYNLSVGFDISRLLMYMGKMSIHLPASSTYITSTETKYLTYQYIKDIDGNIDQAKIFFSINDPSNNPSYLTANYHFKYLCQ